MSLLALSGTNSVSGGYDIDYSLKNESDNGERFQSVNLGTPTSVRTFTFSMWVKRTELAANGSQPYILNLQANTGISVQLQFAADSSTDSIYYLFQNSSVQAYAKTKAVFRDTSAWMHIVWRVDTTQSTATDRVRIYVNGVDQEIESGGGGHPAHPNQNYDVPLQTTQYLLGYDGSNNGFCGYASEYVYVDGQSLAPTAFGETDSNTGIWKPIDLSDLTFGNAGYYLDFADASALGKDVGNSKGNFSHYGGSAADQATDTPTNNFCTMNPLDKTNGNIKTQEGATKVTTDGGSGWCSMVATMGVTKGKWYWEAQRMSTGTPNDVITGIVGSEDAYVPYSSAANYYIGNVATSSSIGYYQKNYPSQEGSVVNGVSLNFYSQGGDTIMFGLDMDNEKMYFGLNGTWKGTGDSIGGNTAGASALHADFDGEFVLPAVSVFQGNNMTINFGGYAAYTISSAASDADGYGTFEYAPPTGYYALCSQNLALYG